MTMLKFKDYIKEMSESEKHALRSNVILLLQHLLSRDYTKGTILQYNLQGWNDEIADYRSRLLKLITKRAGLKPMLKGIDLPGVHALALRAVEKKFKGQGFSLPDSCPYSLEQIVGSDVWRKLNH
jgi:hypothetical protein